MCPGYKLLDIAPLALIFPFELDRRASCSLQLSNNNTDHHVAFKVKTTSPSKYSVSFNCWILPPMSKCSITVAVKHPDILCEDKFLVQSVIVSNDALLEGTAATLFKKEPGKAIHEVILPVSYSRKITTAAADADACGLRAPDQLDMQKGECAGIESENQCSQLIKIQGSSDQPCAEETENELANSRNELEKYKLYIDTLNENKKLEGIESSLVAERERSARLEQDLEEERSEFENKRILYYKKLKELKNEVSKKSIRCQETELELLDACIQLKEREDSLHEETKKRIEAEEQLINKKTELQNVEKSQQEMLREMEQLKRQNADLQNERDKIIRELEEFRRWIEGLASIASSSDRPVNNYTEFSYSELKKETNDFEDVLKIGEGGYGNVYRGSLRHTTVAIKILKRESRQGETEFNQEVEILSRVRHPNLVMLIGACREAYALVYEFMPNGSLQDILRNKKRSKNLTWKTRIRVASDICSALVFLHSAKPHGIVHGDLKPANILLDSNHVSKLSDFGICRQLHQTVTRKTPHHRTNNPKGTIPYMDPEYLNSGELTPQYDVYSFGIVLLELVTGRSPMGLRTSVEDALHNGRLERFVDASAGKWPFEEAMKMTVLGLRCSDPSRKNRPDLAKEVLGEIKSMMHMAFPQ